jgi:Asp-tRNA(Asn)/Glu-tRNA(Gln) amidotransferase A subunit family amidase
MRSELANYSASQLSEMIAKRQCSSEEILLSCFDRINRFEPTVKAFVDLQEQAAMDQARLCDRTMPRGPLHGVPVAVKDTVDVAKMRCTWGTPIHADRVPDIDAAVVRRLREAGAVIIGTTVTTEYAIAKAGPTTNPHNPAYTPGGSSSGSGAAVAAGMVPLAIATQSVGSIIRPSIFCGVFGLKPTLGAISTVGVMPLSPRLDHVGPMSRTVADIELACSAIFGPEPTEAPSVAPPLVSGRSLPVGTKILRIEGPLSQRIEPPTAEALDRAHVTLGESGFAVTNHELPKRFAGLVECYEAIIFTDLARRHVRDRDQHADMMSERMLQIIETGLATTNATYDAALAEAEYFRGYLLEIVKQNTVILSPATDGSAPLMSDKTGEQKLQALWTVVGFPSLATPCGKRDGLPIGVQLVAAPGREDLCLGTGRIVEAAFGFETLQ